MVEGVHGSLDRRDAVALALLGLIGVGIPLWLTAVAGAIGLPTVDDWVYMRGAENLYRYGNLDMPGHTTAAIGQLVLVQPLLWLSGGSTWAFTAFGLIMTLVGLVATYLLARRFVGTGSAVIIALLVLVFPGFARLSASFMTDVPASTLAVLCLLLGSMWLEDGRRLTLVASLGAGLLAVSIREFAIAAPAAILIVGWARSRTGDRAWLAVASGVFVAGVAVVLITAASMPGHGEPGTPIFWRLVHIGPMFVTFGAVLFPALALGIGRRMSTISPGQILLGAGLVGFGVVVPWGQLLGNIWMDNGLTGDLLLSGTREAVIGADAWEHSRHIASFAAILLAALAFSWGQRNLGRVSSVQGAMTLAARMARRRDGLLVLFLFGYAAELIAFSAIGIFDRYLFPMVPVAAILLLSGRTQPSRFGRSLAFSHAAFAWLAVSAFFIAANSFAYDAARWREGEAAVAMGYDAGTVDAGYEWVGYNSGGLVEAGSPAPGLTSNIDRWASRSRCAVLSNSPLDDDSLKLIRVNRSAYLQYLFFGPREPLYLYGAVAEGCPPLPGSSAATQAP
jgi:hypothetical protein